MKWIVKDKSFYKTILMLALPMALQNILSMGVGLSDNIMVGQLGEASVAGILAANQVQNILTFLVIGVSSSLVVLASQYWGKGDTESVKAIAAIGIKIAVCLGLLVSITTIIFPTQVLRIFTNAPGAIEEGARYIRILAFSYGFFCLTQTLMGTMRCVEVVKIGVVVSLSTLIIAVTGNYLLIFGNFGFPELGVQGAAVATLAARVMETVIMVVYVRFIDKRLKIRFMELLKTNTQLLKDFFRYGLPVMGGDLSWGIIGATKVAVVGRLGESAMAANSVAAMLFGIITIVVWSTSGASGVTIGKTVGSGDYEKVKQYAKTLQVIFVCLGIVAGISLFSLRTAFLSIYDFGYETQVLAMQFMTILSFSVVFTSYHAPCFTGIIRAGGDTRFVFIVDGTISWLLVLPMTFLAAFVFHAPPWVVFLCIFSDQFYKWIIAAIKVNRFRWIKNLTR